MASVKFFIRSASKDKKRFVNIRARLKDGQNEVYGKTHLSIPLEFWNPKGKHTRAKVRNTGDFNDRDWTKDQLESLEKFILSEYQKYGEPKNEWLALCIDRFARPEKYENKPVTLFSYIENFIKQSEQSINPKTGRPVHYRIRRDYIRTFELLKEFSKEQGREIDFNDIDLDFYNDFVEFLQRKNYTGNTVGKFIKNLKVFLNKATEENINTNLSYKSHRFVKIQVETDSVALSENELSQLWEMELDKPYLEKTRDLFLVGCWTGLRFGDLTNIKPENIEDGYIRVTQSKTGDRVVIPLHPVVTTILEKYEGELPKAISNQKTNQYLKTIAQKAGISTDVHITETKGGIKRTVKRPKWELISTHTARRSFATNLYKSGFPAHSIMQITGHKSESAFLRYIKVSPDEHAKLLREHWLKSGSHLKIAK